eukprot:symbB.v1.2.041332.t1/scaffold8070.1/size7898/1
MAEMSQSALVMARMGNNELCMLKIPSGAFLDLSTPILPEQFAEYDVKDNYDVIEKEMMAMTREEIKGMFKLMDRTLDKKERKETAVKKWIAGFRHAQEVLRNENVSRILASASASSTTVVEVASPEEAQRLAEQIKQVAPNANVVSVASQEEADRLRAEHGTLSFDTAVPKASPAPSAFQEFKGQGYKLAPESDDAPLSDEMAVAKRKEDFEKNHSPPDFSLLIGKIPPKWTSEDQQKMDEILTSEYHGDELQELEDKKMAWATYEDFQKNIIELSHKTSATCGTAIIKVETVSGKFDLLFHYDVKDRISDLYDAIQENLDLSRDRISLRYSETYSFFEEWEPLHATLLSQSKVILLGVKMAGGGKIVRKTSGKKTATSLEVRKKVTELGKEVSASTKEAIPYIAQIEVLMSKFLADGDVGAQQAFEKIVAPLDEKHLDDLYKLLDSRNGGDTNYKLRKMAHILFGEPMEKTLALTLEMTNVIDATESAVKSVYLKGQENSSSFKFASIRSIVKTFLDRKIGARASGVSDVAM